MRTISRATSGRGRGRTAEPVVFRQADQLLMETTFGLPRLVFPAAIGVDAAVMRFVNGAIADGETPVLLGCSPGKAQEAPALLHPLAASQTG